MPRQNFVHDYPRSTALIREMELTPIDPQDETLLALLLQQPPELQRQYKVGAPVDVAEHLRTRWLAMRYHGRVVAVFGEIDHDARTLEIAHAYPEPTRLGKVAVMAMFLRYMAAIHDGTRDRIVFTVLYANEAMWRAVIRETKQLPLSLRFCFTREGHV